VRRRPLVALALLASALLIPGCGDKTLTDGLEEPLAVHDAQFVEGVLPGSPPDQALASPRPTAATTEVTFLRPNLPGVPFFGWTTLDAVSVGARIEGQGSGYWVVPTGTPDPAVQGEPVRVWRFVADLHAGLPPGRHRLLVAATDAAGNTGSQVASSLCINRLVPDNGNVCDPKKPPPELVISLAWDRPADLDLIVVTPSGDIVASRSPAKALAADQKINRNALDKNTPGLGFLDFDSNQDCRIDGRQRENVVFADHPEPGSYLVFVNLHDACREQSVRYAVARHTRSAADPPEPGSFSVVETDRTHGTLVAVQANGSTALGTFVTELYVQ
jgi:hypothetical protein